MQDTCAQPIDSWKQHRGTSYSRKLFLKSLNIIFYCVANASGIVRTGLTFVNRWNEVTFFVEGIVILSFIHHYFRVAGRSPKEQQIV